MIRILIPCFIEASVIEQTNAKLTEIMQQDSSNNNYKYELLFIDDGSKDQTLFIPCDTYE
nr:glycosyltransferase [Staphylococcus edaphicus]